MAFGLICLIYVIGLVLIFAELFLPGAFLGFIGTAVLVSSIVLSFYHHPENPAYGILLIFISLIVIPITVIWWLRKVSLGEAQKVEDGYTSADESLESLVNQEGMTVTILRPSGIATIGGRRIDVTAENAHVPAKTPIQVVKIEGNRVLVRATGPTQTEE